jgi:hypothetical protein
VETRRASKLPDAVAVVVYLGLGVLVMGRYLAHPGHVVNGHLPSDNTWFEWLLEHGAYSVRHLANPLFSHRQNVPDGVNMMANTSVLGVTIPLAPLTLLFGGKVTYVVWTVLACAGTAATGYWALSRHLVGSRVAAFAGGAFAGFAPGVVLHANGQPNFVSNFLLPIIVVRVLGLAETARPARDGLVLGLLVVWQLFINEELLLLTSVTAGCLLIAYVVRRRTGARRVTRGLVVTAIVVVVLAAYPLAVQFAGPQSYRQLLLFHDWGGDVAAFGTMPRDSLGGVATPDRVFGETEQNTFYGWPLLIAVAALTVLVWRRERAARIAVVVALAGAAGSLGQRIRFDGRLTGLPGPWKWIPDGLPVIGMVMPSRLAFLTTGALAVLIALGWDALAGRVRDAPGTRRADRARLGQIGFAAALLTLTPTPLVAVPDPGAPHFITSGAWRHYVRPGTTLVPVPVPDVNVGRGTFAWTVDTGLEFPVPGGYFLGPDARGDGRMGGQPDYTETLLRAAVAGRTAGPELTPARRAAVRRDLARWHASVVVLSPAADALQPWLDGLLGPAQRVDDVWLWPIPPGAASASPAGSPARTGSPAGGVSRVRSRGA